MSSKKRKFKYKLSGFEQMWIEIERLEEREEILVRALQMMAQGDLQIPRSEYMQTILELLQQVPGKSAGYKMIENMGLDFYEKAKDLNGG